MIRVTRLHHTAIAAHDLDAMRRFYTEVIGLDAHPTKTNWLRAGNGFVVHLMPSPDAPASGRIEQHFALEVESLRETAAALLRQGVTPYMASLEYETHAVTDAGDPLDFGIGTLFVADPEGNTIEFVEPDTGIFAEVPLEAQDT
ncbi:VOC family protein [Methylobacterium sp. J-043]|uniref:VOC family protein n=1 Tax=Methylobacteriaceae TaxID=119045 RepID=UPI00074F8484|nr:MULTISPECIES: VOC family protein [Methylobacteriaceae]MCJ2029455.1 VOC family protein [Methylobacterium sp. J-043]MDF9861194.1 catechol 2,3-dioxygenase-like lactoylglutathione lyase family enzyme [Methylorubrum pseudosasae]MDH6639974.1 catechol 2,3-dioxygenase-like lactoylglutathione lyase family enzyme [Methylobacterium sp. SuP10 SLI 274]AMB44841.1 hypothetical protein Y590_08045 [Methylobacterium sp. AMS5]MCP1551629.1 catechol 2,3-dioxygenase-like lactoylglutathione lyase family enzyme [M